MKSQCLNCLIEFKYSPSQSRGKYCSNKCQMTYQRDTTLYKKYVDGRIKNLPTIKKFLINLYGYNCVECAISEYNKKPITLQVDHIDGDSDNNYPSNVRLLCPNCHSQTPTYKGGNKNKTKQDARNVNKRQKYATLKQLRQLQELQNGTVV